MKNFKKSIPNTYRILRDGEVHELHRPEFKSQTHHLTEIWPWASFSLFFLIYNVGITEVVWGWNELKHIKGSERHWTCSKYKNPTPIFLYFFISVGHMSPVLWNGSHSIIWAQCVCSMCMSAMTCEESFHQRQVRAALDKNRMQKNMDSLNKLSET